MPQHTLCQITTTYRRSPFVSRATRSREITTSRLLLAPYPNTHTRSPSNRLSASPTDTSAPSPRGSCVSCTNSLYASRTLSSLKNATNIIRRSYIMTRPSPRVAAAWSCSVREEHVEAMSPGERRVRVGANELERRVLLPGGAQWMRMVRQPEVASLREVVGPVCTLALCRRT